MEKTIQFLEKICDRALLLLGAGIFCGLTYYSLRYTEELVEGTEIPMTVRDQPGRNLLVFVVVAAISVLLRKILAAKIQWNARRMKRLVVGAAIYVLAVSLVWVSFCHVKARADGGSLCYVAKLMLEGRYGSMIPPGYMSYNPHQFSLLLVIEILFQLFGVGNYQAFQYMNALCMPLLFYAGYRILTHICEADEASETQIYYILLFVTNMPIFLYVAYVYGETTSITFTTVLIWQVIRFCKTGKKTSMIWGTFAIVFACIMRMNSLIVLVAAGIVLVVYALREKKAVAVVWLILMFVCVTVSDSAIRTYYENLTGNKVLDGIPYISYVRMGLQDGEHGPGWYDQSNYTELIAHDYDTEQTAEDDLQKVRDRLREFRKDKSYGIDFFRRKILSQWNAPAYHGLYETGVFNIEKEKLPYPIKQIYVDKTEHVKVFLNRYQFLLYAFAAIMAVASLVLKKRENHLEDHLLLIAVIGGFLFSILWEAMSRYTLPYVTYMIPLAALGMRRTRVLIHCGIEKIRCGQKTIQ